MVGVDRVRRDQLSGEFDDLVHVGMYGITE
jgi:hypothetical protein